MNERLVNHSEQEVQGRPLRYREKRARARGRAAARERPYRIMRYQEHAMRAVTRYILPSRAWVDHLVKPLASRERRNAFSQLTGRTSAPA